jgi:hypothetical protein
LIIQQRRGDSSETRALRTQLAELDIVAGRASTAQPYFEETSAAGEGTAVRAYALERLGEIHLRRGRFAAADQAYEELAKRNRRNRPSKSRATALLRTG